MSRKAAAAALVSLGLLGAACNGSEDPLAGGVPSAAPVPSEQPAVAAPTGVATVKAPSPSASRTPAPPTYDVKAVQTQLIALHYYVGAVDGERGGAFRSAVMAFQKVNGLGADGTVGPRTLLALKTPKKPSLRGSGQGTRVEVDLTKQVLLVVKDGTITRILPVSSGSGKHYLTKSGSRATALSPVGYYTITRRIIGEREADLGTLYDPQYFYKGWAIHGSNSVPAYPASHGCVRVTRTDAKYLLKAIDVGTRVYLYGGSYTFTAGSAAPGTDDPGGDTPDSTTTSPAPSPATTPSAGPTPVPSASPTASPTPSAILPHG